MRLAVLAAPGEKITVPVELGSTLPAVYRDYDPNALRFTSALDAVLQPVWMAIDCFSAYLDPALTPEDMVPWLANWVGIVVDDNWRPEQLRRLVGRAADLYRWRGTLKGIAELVEAYTGLVPEVSDNGGVGYSMTPGGAAPGSRDQVVRVRVTGAGLTMDDLQRLRRFLLAAIPANVTIRLEAN